MWEALLKCLFISEVTKAPPGSSRAWRGPRRAGRGSGGHGGDMRLGEGCATSEQSLPSRQAMEESVYEENLIQISAEVRSLGKVVLLWFVFLY